MIIRSTTRLRGHLSEGCGKCKVQLMGFKTGQIWQMMALAVVVMCWNKEQIFYIQCLLRHHKLIFCQSAKLHMNIGTLTVHNSTEVM